jgi:hypothetical protein
MEKTVKKGFFIAFSLVCILSNTVLNGMIGPKARQSFSRQLSAYRVGQAQNKWSLPKTKQKTVYYTKTSPKLILFDRLTLYYDQLKQNLSQLLYGESYQETIRAKAKMINDKITTILSDIHNKEPHASQSFDTFLRKRDQNNVNQLLDQLIFTNHEIDFLNTRATKLFIESATGNKDNIDIARKMINWTKENITRFFFLNENIINDEFFLISLLYIDSNLDKKLIPVIHDDLKNIKNSPSGKKFFTLIKSKNPTIYDAIMQRDQTWMELFIESVKKSLNEWRAQK